MEDEDIASQKEMREEAIRRLQAMHVDTFNFQEHGVPTVSEQALFGLYSYPLGTRSDSASDVDEMSIAEVKAVNTLKDSGYLPYYVLVSPEENFGPVISILYVSPYKEDWETQLPDDDDGYVGAYVFNVNDESLSEWGTIVVKHWRDEENGDLVRVG